MIGPCDPTEVPVQCILTDTLDILSRTDVTWTSMLDGSPLYLRLKPPCPVPPKVKYQPQLYQINMGVHESRNPVL